MGRCPVTSREIALGAPGTVVRSQLERPCHNRAARRPAESPSCDRKVARRLLRADQGDVATVERKPVPKFLGGEQVKARAGIGSLIEPGHGARRSARSYESSNRDRHLFTATSIRGC